MEKEKRYAVVIDAYLFARNDNEAKLKAAKLVEYVRKFENNNAQTIELNEIPFDKGKARLVHRGKLNIFENKIINS